MSGVLFPPASGPGEADDSASSELFATAMVVSAPPKRQTWRGAQISLILHVIAGAALILVPIFWFEPPPDQPNLIRALLYDPPPPPPPPLPKGSGLVPKAEPAKPVTPDPTVKKEPPKFEAPIEPKP